MKIAILGNARHGKDSAAEYWRDKFGLTFKSSSEAAAEIFLYDTLKEKYGYKNFLECFEDRVNHRKEWYDLIVAYNNGECKLTKEILKTSDCYVGMRSLKEFNLSEHLFDLVIWIDASKRVEPEPKESMDIPMDVADFIITNNGTLKEFEDKLHTIGKILFKCKTS